MRPLVRTTILTLLLLPPAMLWGIGVVVREEWPPRLLMGVTAALNVGYIGYSSLEGPRGRSRNAQLWLP